MPRFCKICQEQFSSAAKLADHLKISDCSNHVTTLKCPYCNREDFVDKDSLYRHLSQNRRCSRADYEASDKLSILAPDRSYMKQCEKGRKSEGEPMEKQHISYVDTINSLEGSMVNIANAMAMQAMHQMNTSLHPDPETVTFIVTLSEDCFAGDSHGKDIYSTDKCHPCKLVDVQILQNEVSAESHHQVLVEDISIPDSSNSSEIPLNPDDQGEFIPPQNIEFDAGDESYEAEEGVEDGHAMNNVDHQTHGVINNPAVAGDVDRPIVKTFHGGSQQLDCLADLYSMLDKRGVANSLFDEITQWAWLNGPTFGRHPPMKRRTVVHKVFQHVRGDNYKKIMCPKQKLIKLSTGRHVAVTYFPIEMMIKDLLCNSTLMKSDHLLIGDIHNPCADLDITHASFGEVNTGSWWRTAMETECTAPNDMLWPLIMFIDGMKVDNLSGKLRLEPITFTFSRFHRWVRNQDNAWRTWAYMEEVKEPLLSTTDNVGLRLTPKDRLQEYHDILGFLMKDLKKIQAEGLPWTLDFGNNIKHDVVLKLPLQFVIGDCEGHDKLVGRFKGHTQNIKGLCRDCDVPTQFSDDENWVCTFFEESNMEQLSKEELRQLSFHKVDNGMDGISVGGCSRGLRTLFNPELLHLYKSGHCEWTSDGYIYSLSSAALEFTKTATIFFVNMNRGQSDRSFPALGTFRDGLVKPNGINLEGHEKHERLFVIYLLLCCSDYVSMLGHNVKRGTCYNVPFYKKFLQLLEYSLSFHEWSTNRNHSFETIIGNDGSCNESPAHRSLRRYLSMLKAVCPREELGKNYRMTKFHQTLHFPDVIARHGSLMNLDGSCPESMAKGNVKDPASHTQRVASSLSYQTGKRYMESLTFREYKRLKAEESNDVVNCAVGPGGYINNTTKEAKVLMESLTNAVGDTPTHNSDVSIESSGTKFCINLDVDQPSIHQYSVYVTWEGQGRRKAGCYDKHLLQQLGKRLFGASDGGVVVDNEIKGCTCVKVNGQIYNADPMYRNEHQWHDWVYIKWQGYDVPYPARIDMFLDLRTSDISNEAITQDHEDIQDNTGERSRTEFRHTFLEKKLYAVVWSTKCFDLSRDKTTEHHFPLNLAYRVELEPFRRLVDVDSFVKPCFGFLNTCGISGKPFDKTAIILKDRSTWAEHFLS